MHSAVQLILTGQNKDTPINTKEPGFESHEEKNISKLLENFRAGNSLIRPSPILLKSNERQWVIRSDCSRQISDRERIAQLGRSRQISDREQIAQVAQDKWAAVRDLLRSLMINEQMSASLKKFRLQNLKSYFIVCFIQFFFYLKNEQFAHSLFLVSNVSESLRSLTKMSDVSKLLKLLTKNEQQWAICWGRSPKMSNHERIALVAHQKWANGSFFWVNRSFAHFWAKNERFAQKTDERIDEFPALENLTADGYCLSLSDEIFDHFPVFDNTFGHIQ